MRKFPTLVGLSFMLLTWHSCPAAVGQDYQPPPVQSSPDTGNTTAPSPSDYQQPNAAARQPPAGETQPYATAPSSAVAPYGSSQYPSLPLQGQIEQNQRIAPPASQVIPGYAQQQGTIYGGAQYPNPQFGNPMRPRAATPTAPLQGRVQRKDEAADGRPAWLPAYAYTNDAMVAPYHNMDIFFWDKRPIPNKPQWIRLATSVSKYWRGYVPEPCMVLATPMENAPGNFTFRSPMPGAPRGWLQHLQTTNWQGFPMYRYWFDQR